MTMAHPLSVPALPAALAAEQFELTNAGACINYYRSVPVKPSGWPPLLLVHSVNAAGSAAEVAPLFEHYRATRAVYALDLPGFGLSSRAERAYSVRLMTDAVLAVIDKMRADHNGVPVDVLGVSLAAEYVARAQREAPSGIRRLVFVSPQVLVVPSGAMAHQVQTWVCHGCIERSLGPFGLTAFTAP